MCCAVPGAQVPGRELQTLSDPSAATYSVDMRDEPDRRSEQRFPLRLPVLVRSIYGETREEALTSDVSARGAFFYLAEKLAEGTLVELILTLPAEITLTESIHVRCKGKIVRVVEPLNGNKLGVAAAIEQYDFLH